jgi:geranylgeranyl pyrophosphate synthase
MFQYAFRLVAALEVAPEALVRLIDRMANSTLNVIEGQAQEFAMKDERHPGVDRYLGVIRGKTSGLFALPIVGAMEALGIDPSRCRAVEAAAMDLGMLFQIQDDILDVYGQKGRDRVATDVAEGKISIFVAQVNDSGTPAEKAELERILRKPRAETTDDDISRAIAIFERNDARGQALGRIRTIQRQLADDASLKQCPEIRGVLIELGETFLEPLNGIV